MPLFPKGDRNLATAKRTKKDALWTTLLTILAIACFPINPLVLTGVIEAESSLPLFIIGWFPWAVGLVMVMAPIVMFPRRGGVAKGKSFVSTTRLVDSGIYAVVRHPQYTGGIFIIFITNMFWNPHWLFVVLGVVGAVVLYLGCREEDKYLVEKFGDDYKDYMQRVPGMNFLLGIIRLLRHSN